MSRNVLDRFSAPTAAWFRGNFDAPTDAQRGAWESISSGSHTLVVAPTGSGKTLSAFLWALDRLATTAPESAKKRCRVLYVSPLKALAVDVERNLRAPLVGIGHAAQRLGLPLPDIRVAVRTGDTPAGERRSFASKPDDVLITTPESLFLLLTSAAREALTGVETVIVDEVHALAGTKRGAHLALSLERLDALLPARAQRIGLSATVRPIDEVARYLAGGRPVEVVAPPSHKEWDLEVVVPVADLGAIGEPTGDLAGPAAGDARRTSIWPHVEERLVDLISSHRSTLVFANSRRLAERITSRLNEIWAERQDAGAEALADLGTPLASVNVSTGSIGRGAPALLARAHHGSVSKEQRALTEEDLKAGRLPAVVATSSLELGIDMGAVDLVIQVEAPPSVASGLQRVGRAGHQVGAVSHGVFFPKFRGDLVQSAVIVERMLAGDIEELRMPSNPLDVLAQQVVAMVAMDEWSVRDLERVVRAAGPFGGVTRPMLESVLDMLSGRYPSDEFAELRPRLVWDRTRDLLSGRRGSQRLAVTSGGTIPDRGLFGVFIASGEGPGRRVGELDEEMVYESRVGDVITLGTSTWRVEDITHDRVLVSPAPGSPGRLPFWKGDTLGRPAELGAAVGAFVREMAAGPAPASRKRARSLGLDEWATDNLIGYLDEQREFTGHLPTDRTIVVERFRDELGDWRIVIHTPYGAPVHAPWALCIAARLQARFGIDTHAMHADDGIVIRLPDLDWEAGDTTPAGLLNDLILDPGEVNDLVTSQIGGSALFASRFRECAGRALLLPKRRPDRRQALWQQRLRSAQLLEVASQYPSFPIVLEAVRECFADVFDVPGLVTLMQRIAGREVSVVEITTPSPSPFAQSLLFGYVAQFMYEGDSPLAERRAAALTLDPGLLAELLGTSEGLALRDLLDPEALTRAELELQHLAKGRLARDADDVTDILRAIGPLPAPEVAVRCSDEAAAAGWLEALEAERRVIRVRVADRDCWAAVEDAARLRDALGCSLPLGVPDAFLAAPDDPLGDLVGRYARTHATFTLPEVSAWMGLGPAAVRDVIRRRVADGRIVEGELRPAGWAPPGRSPGEPASLDYCDAGVLRSLRRRSLAALRAEVEPVTTQDFARFLPAWQGVGEDRRGVEGVLAAVDQLSGAVLPASALETIVLPARVSDYRPAMLDELMASGEVLWQGHGELAGGDGWVSLHAAESAPVTLADPAPVDGEQAAALLEVLRGGGGHFWPALMTAAGGGDDLSKALWELVWGGWVSNDTLAPLRAMLAGGGAHRSRPRPTRPGRYGVPRRRLDLASPRRVIPPRVSGRWALLPQAELDPTAAAVAKADLLLDRYGVLTRGSAAAGTDSAGFGGLYRVLAAAEESGRVRRGYFIEGLGAAQFGTANAVDRLRGYASRTRDNRSQAVVLAATDPANPFGAAVPWPARSTEEGARGHQPGRKGGALVVLRDGELVLYVERGGRTLLSWSSEPAVLQAAAQALADAVHAGALGTLTVERVDGEAALGSAHPLAQALADAGFHLTPRGLRLRR